jgi:hypothetical protein
MLDSTKTIDLLLKNITKTEDACKVEADRSFPFLGFVWICNFFFLLYSTIFDYIQNHKYRKKFEF